VIEGGADGADKLAREESAKLNLHCATVPALWATRHRSAGPQRNNAMIALLLPNLVIAFGGDRGTDDCVERARKQGIEVIEIDRDKEGR
jgi:hypothetical protein